MRLLYDPLFDHDEQMSKAVGLFDSSRVNFYFSPFWVMSTFGFQFQRDSDLTLAMLRGSPKA